MSPEKLALRAGAIALAFALLFRLSSCEDAPETFAKAAFFLSSGRVLREAPQTPPPETDPPPTTPPAVTDPQPQLPVFSPETADSLRIAGTAAGSVDKAALLTAPLCWDLQQDVPTVLILHTHGSESYENTEGYTPSSEYRTLDENYNMLSIGAFVAQRLEAAGISVLQDRQLHDYPSYNGSYVNSRESLQKYLKEYPSIRLVLDLHRDAAEDASGRQIRYTAESKYGKAAKLMLVMGTDTPGRPHESWQENLSLALKLQAALEQDCPGVTRPISLRSSRLNQDLSTGAVLVEVGAAGNTRQEACNAAALLADAVIALSRGTG